MAPPAFQRATLEEHGRAYSVSVMNGKFLNIGYIFHPILLYVFASSNRSLNYSLIVNLNVLLCYKIVNRQEYHKSMTILGHISYKLWMLPFLLNTSGKKPLPLLPLGMLYCEI